MVAEVARVKKVAKGQEVKTTLQSSEGPESQEIKVSGLERGA